jgi:L-amino acid N-acyltransferase YncA
MLDDFPKKLPLKNGQELVLRILTQQDAESIVLFFLSVPEEERNFLRYDITDKEALKGWFGGPNWEEVFPIAAVLEGDIVGIAVLQGYRTPWFAHIGNFWMIVSQEMRGRGLGRILANEMFTLAAELGMEKLSAEVRADHLYAIRIFKQMGYQHEGALTDYIKDQDGQTHDLLIMACNIKEFFRRLSEAHPNR